MKYLKDEAIKSMVTSILYRHFSEIMKSDYGMSTRYKDFLVDDYCRRLMDGLVEPITAILVSSKLYASITTERVASCRKEINDVIDLWIASSSISKCITDHIINTYFEPSDIVDADE